MDTDNQPKKQSGRFDLKPYQWKKGQSGNPKGRPKGKTLKEFAREYLESLPDDEKIDYLASLPTEIVWKMAEGNPDTKTDITSKGERISDVDNEALKKAAKVYAESIKKRKLGGGVR